MLIYTYSFLGLVQQLTNLTAAPSCLIKGDLFRLRRCRNRQEELPCVRGQERCPRSGAVPEARGGGREEQPHVQGLVAVRAQEVLEEPSHFEGLEWQR